MGRTCGTCCAHNFFALFCFDIQNNLCTEHVLSLCTELVNQWTIFCHIVDYCWTSASDKDLPVFISTLTLASRHAEGRVSKRSTSSERRPLTPTPSLKRKRRSSVSPPRKRRTSPPPTSSTKSKTSYTAVPSRSGSQGKGGDRDLRESHPRYLLFVWISVLLTKITC